MRRIGQPEGLSLALSFFGLLLVGSLFVRLLILLVFVLLNRVSVPAPNPKQAILAESGTLWVVAGLAALVWLAKLGLMLTNRRAQAGFSKGR